MRVATYRRVSVDSAAENGSNVSLEVQADRLRALAAAHGWEIVADFCDDGLSGKSLDRPGVQKLFEAVCRKPRPFDSVLVYSLSRATRRIADLGRILEAFDRAGVGLVSLTEGVDSTTGAGRLVLSISGSVAEWERSEIRSRTSAALQYRRKNLQVYGGEAPFGFKLDGRKLVPVPEKLAIVGRMFEMRHQGLSLRQIRDVLAEMKVKTQHGRERWGVATIDGLLKRGDFYRPHLPGAGHDA